MYFICITCMRILIKLIFEELHRVHSLCPILFYSYKKLAENKESEFVRPLPLNMNPNVMSQEPRTVNQFLDRNEENVVLEKATNEGTETNHPRVNTVEEQIDKMYLDILKKKISVGPSLLPQDDKINKVSFYNSN